MNQTNPTGEHAAIPADRLTAHFARDILAIYLPPAA
jgi:hypothetical protein